jgi:hypothetical protein
MITTQEEIELNYDELKGQFRTFESGTMTLFYEDDRVLKEVKVFLDYDNGDFYGKIEKHYKLGDTVRILDYRMNDIGGIIGAFIRVGNVVKVQVSNKLFYLIDCLK